MTPRRIDVHVDRFVTDDRRTGPDRVAAEIRRALERRLEQPGTRPRTTYDRIAAELQRRLER